MPMYDRISVGRLDNYLPYFGLDFMKLTGYANFESKNSLC